MLLRKQRIIFKEFQKEFLISNLNTNLLNLTPQVKGTHNWESLGHNEQVMAKKRFLNLRDGSVDTFVLENVQLVATEVVGQL